jgi:hypothetical protein
MSSQYANVIVMLMLFEKTSLLKTKTCYCKMIRLSAFKHLKRERERLKFFETEKNILIDNLKVLLESSTKVNEAESRFCQK